MPYGTNRKRKMMKTHEGVKGPSSAGPREDEWLDVGGERAKRQQLPHHGDRIVDGTVESMYEKQRLKPPWNFVQCRACTCPFFLSCLPLLEAEKGFKRAKRKSNRSSCIQTLPRS